jgi:hypothetical protein
MPLMICNGEMSYVEDCESGKGEESGTGCGYGIGSINWNLDFVPGTSGNYIGFSLESGEGEESGIGFGCGMASGLDLHHFYEENL